MRLERLDLAPYGRFTQKTLSFSSSAALHVVLGRNEAGKSTSLSALRDFLFGFPLRTEFDFLHGQQTLRVGCRLRFTDGETFDALRRKGKQKTLLDATGAPVDEEPLLRALGGVDRTTFETEFGLDKTGLREGGFALLETGGSLAEALAAGSATLGALNTLKKDLREQADELFGPTKSARKPFYVALDAYTQATRDLRDATVTADELKTADESALLAAAQLDDLKTQSQEIGRAIAKRQRARRVGPDLRRLDALSTELAALADLPVVSADSVARARAALEAQEAILSEAARLDAEDVEEAALRGALGLDPALLTQAEAIDALREDLGNMRRMAEQLPRRIEAFENAEAQLTELARRLGRESFRSLLANSPSDATLARLRTLSGLRRDNARAVADADRRQAAALAELRLAGEAAAAPPLDLAPLKRRLAGFADIARDAERLSLERAALEEEERSLADALARLDPPVADADALARMPLPEAGALEAASRAEAAALDALRSAREAAETARRAAAASVDELRRQETASPGATRADWEGAREAREAAFERLGEALSGPSEVRTERFLTARALTRAADLAVESVLADAGRAARLQATRDARDARREEAQAAEKVREAAEAACAEAAAGSAALWDASGLVPRDVASMIRWLERAQSVLDRRVQLVERRATAAALAARVEAARETLNGWFADAGAAPPSTQVFEEALRTARERLDALTEATNAAAEKEARRQQAARALEALAAERDAAEAEREALLQDWGPAATAAGLRPQATVEEAEAALAVWSEAALPRRDYVDIGHRIETMKAEMAEFARAVDTVAKAGAPGQAGGPAREVLPRLVTALALARKAEDERRRLDASAARRAAKRASLEIERDRIAAALAQAREALAASDDEALSRALERCEARTRAIGEQARLRAALAENGDGFNEADLRAEASAYDPEGLADEIAAAERDQAALLNAISAAGAAAQEAAARREALTRGRDAPGAAAARVEAAEAMRDAGEGWLLRRAAARLAERAVERHRALAQNPLIERAGAFFALATAGGYAGLGVGFDEGDRPILAARRDNGETVTVAGLSEGARDQLFLSLRLALLERHGGEPLPFVGDDLLASFDDERAAHTLDLLAEFGARRQTILFTHHTRVAELARGLQRSVEVLEM